MKYINANKLPKLLESIKKGKILYLHEALQELIEDDEMVKVSEIQKELNIYDSSDSSNAIPDLLNALTDLVHPHPKKYGGLTVTEWGQLNKLEHININFDSHGRFLKHCYFDRNLLSHTLELLPDPEKFYRAHIGDESPVPGNVKVEIIVTDDTVIVGTAKRFRWNNKKTNRIPESDIKAYRILGVSDE